MRNSGTSPLVPCAQYMLGVLMLMVLLLPVSAGATSCNPAEGDAAIPYCRQALLANPPDIDTLMRYADILLDLGRALEAVELLETSVENNPGNSAIRLKLSNAREATFKPSKDSGPSAAAIDRLNVLQCKTRIGQAALNGCYSALEQHPLVWTVDPALQDLEQISQAPAQVASPQVASQNKPGEPDPVELDMKPVETAVATEIENEIRFSNASLDGQVSY